jgi:hypothetical protein
VHNLLAARLDVCPSRSTWTATERAAAEQLESMRFAPVH